MDHYPFAVKPLPYPPNALEPHIDTETMVLHHGTHYANYVKELNKTLEPCPRYHEMSLEQLLRNTGRLPFEIQLSVHNNGGGVYNHELYFGGMSPCSQLHETGALARAIDRCFHSLAEMRQKLLDTAKSVFGSGYVWLAAQPNGQLCILKTANQDTILTRRFTPILALDCWEHAYYLKYHAARVEYVQNWFEVIDWGQAERRYLSSRIYPGREGKCRTCTPEPAP